MARRTRSTFTATHRIVAGEEFRVADDSLVERDGRLHSLDDEFLEARLSRMMQRSRVVP